MNARRKKQLFRYSVDLFVELLRQITKQRTVRYKCNDADVACFNVFIEKFGDGVGENFIRKFAEYGMQSWFNDGAKRDYTHSIRYSWVFGGAAIKRWFALSGDVRTKCVNKGLKKKNNIRILNHTSTIPELINTVKTYEEAYKAAYFNTKRGLLWCVANTTLYHHRSSYCVACDNKDECRETLKKEYPKIYELRGYGK